MLRMRHSLTLLIGAFLAALLTAGGWTQDLDAALAQVRFVHIDAGLPAIDISINGELAAAELRYGDATTRLSAPAGPARLSARHSPGNVALFSEIATLPPGPAVIILGGARGQSLLVAPEDLSPVAAGGGRLLFVNALDQPMRLALAAPDSSPTLELELDAGADVALEELPAGLYSVQLGGGAEAAAKETSLALAAGSVNLLIAHGEPGEPQLHISRSAADGGEGSGKLRFIHAIAGAAPLDIWLDGELLAPALAFEAPVPHLAVAAGLREITVNLGAAEILAQPLHVRAGGMTTLALTRDSSGLAMPAFEDAADGTAEDSAVTRLINAIPNSVIEHLQLESGAIIALNVPFGEAGDAARILPGAQAMTMRLNIGGNRGAVPVPARHFNAGSYYAMLALPGDMFSAPRLMIVETSLARRIRSSLAAAEPAASATPMPEPPQHADEPVPEAPAEEPAPTLAAYEAQPAHEADTPLEAAAIADDSPEAAAAQAKIAPYAIVNLFPDSSLHMRQYPSAAAMSLGLAPADSNLMILGRRGPSETEAGDAGPPPVELSDFTEAAASLQPWQDLPPAETWLYAMYRTPDDGALYGWVNARFLDVFQPDGEPQRLASLAHVRQNQAGRAYNTSIRPPELADRIAARVIGLDSQARLNLRRRNRPDSEVLSQIPPDHVLGILGLDADETWAFVQYQPAIGNPIRGWSSMRFIQLLLNGAPATASSLRALDPSALPTISDLEAGGIQPLDEDEGAAAVEGLAGEVNVNFDSALHLRRYPDATSESLALIPPGTVLPLAGITENGEWIKARFSGAEGWVAARFLLLSLDGRKLARPFLESQLPRYDDSGV